MTVAVVVPWRATDQHRIDAWAHLQRRWRHHHPDWPIIEGHGPDGPWSKGAAIADALTRTTADTIVLADADVWCDHTHLAVKHVAASGGWAIPHWWVHRLTLDATHAVLAGGPWAGPLERCRYPGFAGGGITVIDRHLLDQAPLDPRFEGWGHEDQAAAYAWTTLGGEPWRGTADLWHLWHPPQPRTGFGRGSTASQALLRRYRAALRHPGAMAALVAEYKETTCQSA